MYANRHKLTCLVGLITLAFIPIALLGCQTTRIAPFAGEDRTGLVADDVVLMMRQAGFEDEDIIAYGTELRNALASHGAARLEKDDVVQAIFVIKKEGVYVTTRSGKNFIYSIP